MQRTDSIFFISGKQICGRESPGGSLNSLTQTRVTRNEIGEIDIGLPIQDFKIISMHSLTRETKQMQSSTKKSGWIIDHLKDLKNILVCSIAEYFNSFLFAGFLQIEILILIREA